METPGENLIPLGMYIRGDQKPRIRSRMNSNKRIYIFFFMSFKENTNMTLVRHEVFTLFISKKIEICSCNLVKSSTIKLLNSGPTTT